MAAPTVLKWKSRALGATSPMLRSPIPAIALLSTVSVQIPRTPVATRPDVRYKPDLERRPVMEEGGYIDVVESTTVEVTFLVY